MLSFYYKISNCFGYTYACSFLEQITNRKVPCILGAESKVPVGILEVRLELIPKINDLVGEEVISAQISLEKNRQAETLVEVHKMFVVACGLVNFKMWSHREQKRFTSAYNIILSLKRVYPNQT